jgi:hypothetical protein
MLPDNAALRHIDTRAGATQCLLEAMREPVKEENSGAAGEVGVLA